MSNKVYAQEWLSFAKRNIETARLLFNVKHYEDIIGVEIQQAIEKLLKSIMAYAGIKIPKEHDLVRLYFLVDTVLQIEDSEIVLLRIATNYYKEDRYPNPNYSLPPRSEVKEVLEFAEKIFDAVCGILGIKKEELDNAQHGC